MLPAVTKQQVSAVSRVSGTHRAGQPRPARLGARRTPPDPSETAPDRSTLVRCHLAPRRHTPPTIMPRSIATTGCDQGLQESVRPAKAPRSSPWLNPVARGQLRQGDFDLGLLGEHIEDRDDAPRARSMVATQQRQVLGGPVLLRAACSGGGASARSNAVDSVVMVGHQLVGRGAAELPANSQACRMLRGGMASLADCGRPIRCPTVAAVPAGPSPRRPPSSCRGRPG